MKGFFFISGLMFLAFMAFVFIHSYFLDYIHIYLLFGFIAGSADGFKDTLSHHFSTSVFKKYDPLFWNPQLSWEGKKYFGMKFASFIIF